MKKIALYPGAYKPPTKGHLNVVKQLLTGKYQAADVDKATGKYTKLPEHPAMDQVWIIVGDLVKGGDKPKGGKPEVAVGQPEAIAVWKEYIKANGLEGKAKVYAAGTTPRAGALDEAANPVGDMLGVLKDKYQRDLYPDVEFYPVVGYRSDDANAIRDLSRIETPKKQYGDKGIVTITVLDEPKPGEETISATKLRAAIYARDEKEIEKYAAAPAADILKHFPTLDEKLDRAIQQTLMDLLTEGVDFNELEKTLDDMFDDLDIDINFTKHFRERVLERGLTEDDIIELMKKIHDKYGDEVADMPKDSNRVFTHITRLVDIASTMGSYGYDGLRDLYLKTAYKRHDSDEPEFRTNASSPKLKVAENVPGAPINAVGAQPSKTRQRLQDYTNFIRNILSSEFTVEFKGDHISVTLPIYNPAEPEDYTPHQKNLPEGVGSFNFSPYISSILEYMIDRGMKITPLPEIVLIKDEANAADVFGRTAYYNNDKKEVGLFTVGRHPKDVLRSFCHEMIHHMQNLEGRIPGFTTTNTQEDDALKEIEQEAHYLGSMTMREWEDTCKREMNETKVMAEGVYDSLVTRLSKQVITKWVTDFKKDPKRLFSALDTNIEEEDAKGRPMEFDLIAKIDFKKTKDRTYLVDGGANEGDDESEGFVALSFQVDPRSLPQQWETIAMDVRDVLRHELEHLTQGGWNVRDDKAMADDSEIRDMINKYKLLAPANYFLLDKEVDAMLQGMYYKAKKSRKPFKDVVDYYLGLQPIDAEEKETILAKWRKRLPALGIKKQYWF